MATDTPLIDLIVETLSDLCEEEGANLEPTFHMIDSQFPYWDVYVCMLK